MEFKEMTVEQIVSKYGIARRTVYNWCAADHGRNNQTSRKAIYLSHDEVETVLLMILETEGTLKGNREYTAKALENRLLKLADEFTEIERMKK